VDNFSLAQWCRDLALDYRRRAPRVCLNWPGKDTVDIPFSMCAMISNEGGEYPTGKFKELTDEITNNHRTSFYTYLFSTGMDGFDPRAEFLEMFADGISE